MKERERGRVGGGRVIDDEERERENITIRGQSKFQDSNFFKAIAIRNREGGTESEKRALWETNRQTHTEKDFLI